MEEIEEPVGKFILDNFSFGQGMQTERGLYIHYADVCTLLKKYHEAKSDAQWNAAIEAATEKLVAVARSNFGESVTDWQIRNELEKLKK